MPLNEHRNIFLFQARLAEPAWFGLLVRKQLGLKQGRVWYEAVGVVVAKPNA